jgi:Cu2+-exporting ATPase
MLTASLDPATVPQPPSAESVRSSQASVPPAVAPYSTEALRLLDEPQEWSAFSRALPSQPQCWESNVVVEGMYCAACSLDIEAALQAVPGVLSARVSAASARARIVWSSDTATPSQWMQAVQQAGYRATPANDQFAKERRQVETRKALWRWLVAGLCMMQVMMYAYPAYVAQPGDLSAEMERLLRWASWVLSLPVILFSCGPFFRAALRDLRHGRISMDLPVSLGIVITFAVSTAGTFEPQGIFGKEVYFDSLTMFVFFLLTGRWLELRLRDRTAGSLEALMNRLPDSVERETAPGSFERVAARRLRVGDRIRVHAGEAFCADGVLEQGATEVDESLLTGESRPLPRGLGEHVVAGSHNLSATVLVRVQVVGEGTRFAQIVDLMESAASTKPASAQLVDRLAKPFLVVVLLAAVLACAWWWPTDPGHALMVAVAVLVVTCPCALSLATPAAMLASAGALARSGVLVRNLRALEALSTIDTVVFDKTGTLTSDAMRLDGVRCRAGSDAQQVLHMAAALAAHSLHPASRALVGAAVQTVPSAGSVWHCDGVVETPGAGLEGELQVDAGPAVRVRLGSAAFCGVPPDTGDQLCIHLADDLGWLATFVLQEEVRPQALAALQALRTAGVDVHLLSGDGQASVARVAAALGFLDKQVGPIGPAAAPCASAPTEAGTAGTTTYVRGGCSPADKLAVLRALQRDGHRVAMVGDGLNDGPVLAGAQVSFAFGNAVPLAQAKSDLVVSGSQLSSVVAAVLLARKTMRVVRQNMGWALLYNAACVPLAMLGYLPAWLAGLGMAASSLLVVLNALRLASPLPST